MYHANNDGNMDTAKLTYKGSKENVVINFMNGRVQMYFQRVIIFIWTLNFKKLLMKLRGAKWFLM